MQLIGLPTLILGIIFMTAGNHWFHGAHTVGVILTAVSAAIIVIGFVLFAIVLSATSRRTRRRF